MQLKKLERRTSNDISVCHYVIAKSGNPVLQVTRDTVISLSPLTKIQTTMLNVAVRALRPATISARNATRLSINAIRTFKTTPRSSSGAPVPQLFGSGAKPGEVPTDESQSTGLERFQLLGEMEGVSAFDMEPLDSSRVGTLQNPIKVVSLVSCLA